MLCCQRSNEWITHGCQTGSVEKFKEIRSSPNKSLVTKQYIDSVDILYIFVHFTVKLKKKKGEHWKYFWNVIVSRRRSQSDVR